MKPLDAQSRRLIEDATAGDLPAPGREAELWRSLSSRLDAPLPPTAAAASRALEAQLGAGAASMATTASLGAKLLLSIVSCSVLLGGAAVWYTTRAELEPRPPSAPLAPVVATPRLLETPPPALSALSPAPALSPEPASSLSLETELLASAQRALNSGAPARALALLDRHRAEFAQGLLAPERDAARILALCALNRADRAQRARKQFLRDWPDSPHRARIRSGCK